MWYLYSAYLSSCLGCDSSSFSPTFQTCHTYLSQWWKPLSKYLPNFKTYLVIEAPTRDNQCDVTLKEIVATIASEMVSSDWILQKLRSGHLPQEGTSRFDKLDFNFKVSFEESNLIVICFERYHGIPWWETLSTRWHGSKNEDLMKF